MENEQEFKEEKFIYSKREMALIDAFKTVGDELADIYIGAIRVLRDKNNPDLQSLISHSVREINRILPKYYMAPGLVEVEEEENKSQLKEKIILIIKSGITNEGLKKLKKEKINAIAKEWVSSYEPTHKEKLEHIVVPPHRKSQMLPFAVENVQEIISKGLYNLHHWFMSIAHHGRKVDTEEFENRWFQIQGIWLRILTPLFEDIKELDSLLAIEKPDPKEVNKAFSFIFKPSHVDYFFRRLDKPGWFEHLKIRGVFKNIPHKEYTKDKKYILFPIWYPGFYLVKIANIIPDKVTEVLKEIKTENENALTFALEAVLNLPADYSKKLLETIDGWLGSKYKGLLLSKYATDLLGKFIEAKDFDSALDLLNIISKTVTQKTKTPGIGTLKEATLRIDPSYYKEEVKEKYLPVLTQNRCIEVIKIIETQLNKAISVKGLKDLSYIWRRAIEDNEQNYTFDEIKDIFSEILRDALIELHKQNLKEAEKIIKRYLTEKFSIYRRLAIHTVRACNMDKFIPQILMKKENLLDYEVHHEFFLLLQEKFGNLNKVQKKELVGWIIKGPKKIKTKEYEKYKPYWIYRWLVGIKDYLLNDRSLVVFIPIFKEYESKISSLEHPEFSIYHEEGWGFKSPLDKDTIKSKTPDEFIDYIKAFKYTGHPMEPTPEGLARLFQEVVKENPVTYVKIAERFLEENIYPTYISNFLEGLKEAWRGGKDFDWKPVLSMCEKVIQNFNEPVLKERRDELNVGRFSWVRGQVADLLETGVREDIRKDKRAITDDHFPMFKNILFFILDNDPDPTPEREEKSTERKRDYVGLAINCNRGRALEALFHYALRYARTHADKEAEKGKGPFPPGERFEGDVRDFLDKRLREEISPSVHSIFGRFLLHSYYLDQKWVESKLIENLIFPRENDKVEIWQAHWQGYILYSNFYEQLYKLLRSHFERATKELTNGAEKPEVKERLAQHLMLAYWENFEELETPGSIVKLFFEIAPVEIRKRAISFIGSSLGNVKALLKSKGKEEEFINKDWPRLKRLWEQRVKVAKDDELSEFILWLEDAPENIEQLCDLIKPVIKVSKRTYHEHQLSEYLEKNASKFPVVTMEILLELLKAKETYPEIYIYKEGLWKIIKAAKESVKENPRCKSLVNEAVNLIGKSGYYEFRELLVE